MKLWDKRLRPFLFGKSLRVREAEHERFSNIQALAVLSSDAQSSVAYATEEILLALIVLGQAALTISLPIALSIIGLLAVVINSYAQTVIAYPKGGGSYIVAKENLGTRFGLVAAAALLIDYVLTVAVSASAAVAALHSAVPALYTHRVLICICIILLLAYANTRGVRAAGKIFTIPTLVFIGSMIVLIAVALARYFINPEIVKLTEKSKELVGDIGIFLILRGFASGCTALTGIEAIADGVSTLHEPTGKNARKILIWLGIILGTIFFGLTLVSYLYGIMPNIGGHETVVSQIAKRVFVDTRFPIFYYLIQFTTGLILVLACNTSFQDFPRLSSFLARDEYLPKPLKNLGDKLVYSKGIVVLALLSSIVVFLVGGKVHAIIPFYALGVFISFTLSQAGMVFYWFSRLDEKRAKLRMVVNGLGAFTTALVVVVILITKSDARALFVLLPTTILFFTLKRIWFRLCVIVAAITVLIILKINPGASLIVIMIVAFVKVFGLISRHYKTYKDLLAPRSVRTRSRARLNHTVIVPIGDIDEQALLALEHIRAERPSRVFAVHVSLDHREAVETRKEWQHFVPDYHLDVLIEERPQDHNIMAAIVDYIGRIERRYDDDELTVVIPYLVTRRFWERFLHNQTSKRLRHYLEETDMDIGVEMVYYHITSDGLRALRHH